MNTFNSSRVQIGTACKAESLKGCREDTFFFRQRSFIPRAALKIKVKTLHVSREVTSERGLIVDR